MGKRTKPFPIFGRHSHLGRTTPKLITAWASSWPNAEAREQFLDAVEFKPHYGEARNNLGIILARSGRLEEAIDQFTKALQDDPGSAPIRENLRAAIEGRKRVPEPNPPGSR